MIAGLVPPQATLGFPVPCRQHREPSALRHRKDFPYRPGPVFLGGRVRSSPLGETLGGTVLSSARSGEWTCGAGETAAKTGATTVWPQPGHLTFLPANSSLTLSCLLHLSQANEIITTSKRTTPQGMGRQKKEHRTRPRPSRQGGRNSTGPTPLRWRSPGQASLLQEFTGRLDATSFPCRWQSLRTSGWSDWLDGRSGPKKGTVR